MDSFLKSINPITLTTKDRVEMKADVQKLIKEKEMLQGKKTYFIAVGLALLTFAKTLGWIDDVSYQALLGLLGAGGLAALRAGVTKSE